MFTNTYKEKAGTRLLSQLVPALSQNWDSYT